MDLAQAFPVTVYNSLKRAKEPFQPANPPYVGMYVCGPTVYSEPHLGHARVYTVFDVIFRYLSFLGYKVRYVRNITDVGHLEDEVAGAGEDRISKKARLEKLEPMELVQRYTNDFHRAMDRLNILRPSIEPRATGHIIEQIGVARKILENGYAYEVDGSIYFDLDKYAAEQPYGQLSGKVLEELQSGSRNTEGLSHKKGAHDFALWKHAKPEHIMRWESPWGEGFPGWHLECSVMSHQYLGNTVDIHGGGMDLQFPHHEAEIAQNYAAWGRHTVTHWLHNNMLTIDGQKMARSLGNFITLREMFDGSHPLLEQAYSPMTVRFFILQAHYRSQIDFSNAALQAAGKGYRRLMNALEALAALDASSVSNAEAGDPDLNASIGGLLDKALLELSDDFNSANALAALFELVARINDLHSGKTPMTALDRATFERLSTQFHALVVDVLGLEPESESQDDMLDQVLQLLIAQRARAKADKDWAAADRIRDELSAIGIQLKDGPEGTSWSR